MTPTPVVEAQPANTPLLDGRRAADVVREVNEALGQISFAPPPAPQSLPARRALAQRALARELMGQDAARALQWVGQPGRPGASGAGVALVELFGHLTELVINRLNRLPDKHFLAFLNEAGIDLLPPQPAHAEVVFVLGPDAPPVVHVAQGTQVATQQTETRPEVVFETQERCSVVPTELSRCIVIDPVRWTSLPGDFGRGGPPPAAGAPATSVPAASGAAAPGAGVPAFEGLLERERVFFIGDNALFGFPDATSRSRSTVLLQFVFAEAGDPVADGWHLEWQYWAAPGSPTTPAPAAPGWQPLPEGCVEDQTQNFSMNGNVILRNLPEIGETVVAGQAARWIACRLTGGAGRAHLPVIGSVTGRRRIRVDLHDPAAAAVSAVTAIQVSSAFVNVPLDAAAGFMPFGPRPDRLDAFYVRSDEAFTKPGALVRLEFGGLAGVPAAATSPNLDALTVVWEYYGAGGWVELGRSTRTFVSQARLEFADMTLAFTAPVGATAAGASGAGVAATGAGSVRAALPPVRGVAPEAPPPAVSFRIPTGEGADPAFQPVEVNGQAGYWVRARIAAGNYSVPAYVEILNRLAGSYRFHEPQTFAPLVTQFRVSYGDYQAITQPAPVQAAASRVDADMRDLTPDARGALAAAGNSFVPFSAAEEGPALYLGFVSIREPQAGAPPPVAFPAGEWIQILLDVVEPDVAEAEAGGGGAQGTEGQVASPRPVAWEYWSGQGWQPLQVSDGTHDLSVRGYLGFFAPAGHAASTEFGQTAFWLRSRTHHQPPQAVAAGAGSVRPDERGVRTVRLDASRSQALNGQYIASYEWRLVPEGEGGGARSETGPSPATEETGPSAGGGARSATGPSPATKETVSSAATKETGLSAGGEARSETGPSAGGEARSETGPAANRSGRSPDRARGAPAAEGPPARTPGGVSPRLNSIRMNIVPVLNSITIEDEVLSAADGPAAPAPAGAAAGTPSANQRFALQYTPVLPDIQLEVREEEAGRAQWVPWARVDSFYELDGPSRSFVLDPINGWVQFGDDRRGKIPPAGTDNVRAASYRTHNGANGNVGPGEISVLRNPKDELALISGVTNPEPAVGGSDAEAIEDIRRRGPQLIKHRRQAVTAGGFEWLGREAGTEIAQIFALAARDQAGATEPGRVSVVVVPREGARPEPSAALLRHVQAHLEERALTSLTDPGRRPGTGIFLSGPEYIEACVLARVVPQDPRAADEVELQIRARLAAFLHPLAWPLGRDVHLGDVYAEIEGVPGVDHVVYLELSGSIEQHNLVFAADEIAFDRAGFQPGEEVALLAGDGAVLVAGLVIETDGITREELRFVTPRSPVAGSVAELVRCALLAGGGSFAAGSAGTSFGSTSHRLPIAPFNLVLDDVGRVTGLRRGYQVPFDIPASSEVSTLDRRVRLLLADNLLAGDPLTAVGIYGFKAGDTAALVSADNTAVTDTLRVTRVEPAQGGGGAKAAAFGTEAIALRITLESPGVSTGTPSVDWSRVDALMSSEGFIRLPGVARAETADGGLVVDILCLEPGTQVAVVSGNRRDPRLAFLPVASIAEPDERIIVPEGTLVVSGTHDIEMAVDD